MRECVGRGNGSSSERDDPIADGGDRSLRDGCSELDFKFSENLGLSIIVGGSESPSIHDVEVDDSTRQYVCPLRIRKFGARI